MTIKIIDPSHPEGIAYRSFAEAGITRFANGHSMHFASASNALVNAGNRGAFEYTDAFSITGWLLLDAGTTAGTIISRVGTTRGWRLYLDGSFLILDLMHAEGDVLSGYAPTKVWDEDGFYFWCATYDGSNAASTGLKFYLTGALDGCTVNTESVSASIVEPNADLIIGEGFDGYLDEIGLWRGVLTLPEIENLYITQIPKHLGRFSSPDSSRLIHYFRMGDSFISPDKILDEVSGGYATIVNATRETDVPEPFTPDPPPVPTLPPPDFYWKFDDGPWAGMGSILDSADSANMLTYFAMLIGPPIIVGPGSSIIAAGTDAGLGFLPGAYPAFTFQAWFTSAPQAPNSLIIGMYDGALKIYHAAVRVTGTNLAIEADGVTTGIGVIAAPMNHIAVAYDNALPVVQYYLNGVGPLTVPRGAAPVVATHIQAFSDDNTGGYYSGRLDEFAVWIGTPLLPADAAYIWNGGAGNPLL